MEELIKKILVEALREIIPTTENTRQVNEVMNSKQLAEYLQVSESYIYKNIKNMPHIKVGGTRFRKVDIDNWLADQVVADYNMQKVRSKPSVSKSKGVYQVF